MAVALASAPSTATPLYKQTTFGHRSSEYRAAGAHTFPVFAQNRLKPSQGYKGSFLQAVPGQLENHLCAQLCGEQCITSRRTKVGLIRSTMAAAQETAKSAAAQSKATLYDVPLSNNGARVRFVIYGKGLEDEIQMAKPADLGGMKSEAYLALNPEGKMPLLVTPEGEGIFESKVISDYLLDVYKHKGPSFEPEPENKIRCALIERIHDLYIAANQGSMYRAMDPEAREQGLRELAKQLRILERYAKAEPYLVGQSETTADHALFPTMVFIDFLTPRIYGWDSYLNDKPKLKKWWTFMSEQPVGRRIRDEIEGALAGWVEGDRFEKLGIADQVKENPKMFTLEALEAAP